MDGTNDNGRPVAHILKRAGAGESSKGERAWLTETSLVGHQRPVTTARFAPVLFQPKPKEGAWYTWLACVGRKWTPPNPPFPPFLVEGDRPTHDDTTTTTARRRAGQGPLQPHRHGGRRLGLLLRLVLQAQGCHRGGQRLLQVCVYGYGRRSVAMAMPMAMATNPLYSANQSITNKTTTTK